MQYENNRFVIQEKWTPYTKMFSVDAEPNSTLSYISKITRKIIARESNTNEFHIANTECEWSISNQNKKEINYIT